MSASHGIKFKAHCHVTSHILVDRYQKFWKVLTTKPHNISSQKKSFSNTVSFKRKSNWICLGLNFSVYLSLLLHFLLVCLQQWLQLPLARVFFYETFHLLVSCCCCSQFEFMTSIRFVSLEMNDPFDKIDVITSLQLLFHILPHLKQKCIILCDSCQIVLPSVSWYTKWPLSIQITKSVLAFCTWFDFPKNKMQPVQNMGVPYSVTFCYLLVHLTTK